MTPRKKEWPTLHGAPPPSETAPVVSLPTPSPAPAPALAPASGKPSIAGGAFWAMVFVSVAGIGLTLGFEVRAAKVARQIAAANALAMNVPPPEPPIEAAPPPAVSAPAPAPSALPQITAKGVIDSPPAKKAKAKASASKPVRAKASAKTKHAPPDPPPPAAPSGEADVVAHALSTLAKH